VQVSGLSTALDQGISLGNALNRIDGNTYTARVVTSYTTTGKPIPTAFGGAVGGTSRVNDWGTPGGAYAAGGAWSGDMAGMGEVIRQPNGSTVIPAGSGRALMRDLATGAGGGHSEPAQIIIESGGSRLDDLLVEIIANSIKAKGGRPELLGIKIRRT
jgi:hypothetical protein